MADRQWYTAIGGKQEGPFSDQKLRELIAAGSVRADTLVWCDGMSNWARAAEIPGLVSSASTAAQQPVRAFAAAAAKAGGSPIAVPTIAASCSISSSLSIASGRFTGVSWFWG